MSFKIGIKVFIFVLSLMISSYVHASTMSYHVYADGKLLLEGSLDRDSGTFPSMTVKRGQHVYMDISCSFDTGEYADDFDWYVVSRTTDDNNTDLSYSTAQTVQDNVAHSFLYMTLPADPSDSVYAGLEDEFYVNANCKNLDSGSFIINKYFKFSLINSQLDINASPGVVTMGLGQSMITVDFSGDVKPCQSGSGSAVDCQDVLKVYANTWPGIQIERISEQRLSESPLTYQSKFKVTASLQGNHTLTFRVAGSAYWGQEAEALVELNVSTRGAGGGILPLDKDGDGYIFIGDCDDNNVDIHPGADEICDGVDSNCDGVFDDDLFLTFYRDFDGDGYGSSATTQKACAQPEGYVSNSSDCDDISASINPAAQEACDDGVDNNCDVLIDDSSCVAATTVTPAPTETATSVVPAVDVDRDGYASDVDCDDTRASVNPGAADDCTSLVDMNCDGVVTGCTAAASGTDPNIEVSGEPEGTEETSSGGGGGGCGGGCSLNVGVSANAGFMFFLFGVVFFRFLVRRV